MAAPQTATRSKDDMGRPTYTARVPGPHTVFGGYRMAYADWTRTDDGWDCDYDFDGLPETVFASEGECVSAIAERTRSAIVAKAALYLASAA